jgi:hypothetical protein
MGPGAVILVVFRSRLIVLDGAVETPVFVHCTSPYVHTCERIYACNALTKCVHSANELVHPRRWGTLSE